MKNIKEITLSVLIIISFYTVLTSVFKDKPQVWEIETIRMANDVGAAYSINKVTGEVRLHSPQNKTYINDKLKLITIK